MSFFDNIGNVYWVWFLSVFIILVFGYYCIKKFLGKNKTGGGRGKIMKGGSDHYYATISFVIVIIIIILANIGVFGNLYGGHAGRL